MNPVTNLCNSIFLLFPVEIKSPVYWGGEVVPSGCFPIMDEHCVKRDEI